MKFTNEPFAMGRPFMVELEHKRTVFKVETKTRNSVQFALISASGVKEGSGIDSIAWAIDGKALFAF